MKTNQYGQITGFSLPDWCPAAYPPRSPLSGQYTRLEPLRRDHSKALFDACSREIDDSDWTWLREEKPATPAEMRRWVERKLADDTLVSWIVSPSDSPDPLGVVCYSHIDTPNGALELGPVIWSPPMRGTVLSTEALFLLLKQAFLLGFRRVAWRCDSNHLASRRAAERLGFTYEGRFRQAMTFKNRNRDTDWLSVIDADWPAIHRALSGWLAVDNFTENGDQKRRLGSFYKKSCQPKKSAPRNAHGAENV